MIRNLLEQAMRNTRLSRPQIADAMSYLTGTRITERMLYAYTAPSKQDHRWPLSWTLSLCAVTGDWRIFGELVEKAGYRMIAPWQVRVLELGERVIASENIHQEISQLKDEVIAISRREQKR